MYAERPHGDPNRNERYFLATCSYLQAKENVAHP